MEGERCSRGLQAPRQAGGEARDDAAMDEKPGIDEEPLLAIAARRAVRKARAEAATPEFGRLLLFHASGAAGDALLALALAGSLFFSVPEAEARGKVALYLLLTVAPFAVVAPFLSAYLDRHRAGVRAAMVVTALGRGSLAWLLASRLDSLLLFPIAFGVLVLSRAAHIVRGTMLPRVVPEGRTLVAANASLSKTAAFSGLLAGAIGLALVNWPGPQTELLVATTVFYVGAVPALRIPSPRGRRLQEERLEARRQARGVTVRQAVVAMGGMRLLVGFLVFHLAFALRREDLGSIGLGVLIASAAAGALAGALIAPRLRKRLREEGIIVICLAVAGIVAIVTGNWFSVSAAAVLAFAFGIGSGAAKVAFDSIVQRDIPEGARGWAFARFEVVLQLLWVVGALVPLVVSVPAGPGVIGVGLASNGLAVLYTVGRARRSLPA
jgi:MFS family permease